MFSPNDTIVAIATPFGRGGIGVVRISGRGTSAICATILESAAPLQPRHATLSHVREADGRMVDSVIATFFKGPHSYTGEDVVEVSAHGSPVVLKEIVRAAIRAGARLARPGEFTLRAFLNGKLDLVQAEAVADLVDATTAAQARAAFDQLNGTLTNAIGRLDDMLLDLIARLEASLDFPEDGFHFVSVDEVSDAVREVRAGLERLLADCARGRLIRDGLQVGIVGRPNVGKSCLFNYLVGSDRAIVTDVPGTTRDPITESIDFEGIRLGLVDTAGIRATDDVVEREGVSRSRRVLNAAAVSILILDRSQPLQEADRELLSHAAASSRLIVINKCDLAPAWDSSVLGDVGPAVQVSLKTGSGLAEFRRALLGVVGMAGDTWESPMVTNLRHEELLREARAAVARAEDRLGEAGANWSEEFLLADLQSAKGALEEVTGKRASEDLLEHIFEHYCVGK